MRNREITKTALFIFGILLFRFAAPVSAQEISLSGGVDKTDIAFEDSLTLAVEIKWIGDITSYSFGLLPLPETENLQVVGTSSAISSSTEQDQDITTRTFKYTLRPTGSGVGVIEPIVLNYVAWPDSIPGELMTQQFKILIAAPVPSEGEGGLSLIVRMILAAFIVLAAAVGLVLWKRRAPKAEPARTAGEKFLEAFEAVKSEAQSDRKLFFTKLYKLLTSYLSEEYKLDVTGKTAKLILEGLNELDIPMERKEKIAAWLENAEREKFAPGGGSPGDVLRLVTEIESFFEK
ncbi:MAG: hypothetical protein JSU69_00825 [Candidatus Zixiibacteriota bacterium]|nr:MAG: hypothetical protein JSU69_00825 [candidate division Zixibacteria bacterium]